MPTPASISVCLNPPPAPTMSRMPAMGGSDVGDDRGDLRPAEARRSAEREHRHDDRREQREQRRADGVQHRTHGVALVQPDVGDGLAEHQHDGQQHRGDGEREPGPPARILSFGSLVLGVGLELVHQLGGRLGVHPARGDATEHRPGDDHGGHGHEQAEREGDAEIGLDRADRHERPGVRRHQTVQDREPRQRGNPDEHERLPRPLGDEQHDRNEEHEADLEEHRQPDQHGDERHRPGQHPDAGLGEDGVDDLVGSTGVGQQLAEHRRRAR